MSIQWYLQIKSYNTRFLASTSSCRAEISDYTAQQENCLNRSIHTTTPATPSCSIEVVIVHTGGDNGGTAASWAALASISSTFLVDALCSLLLPIFLKAKDMEGTALDELLLSMDAKNLSLERVVGAVAITELKTPDSLKPCIMVWDSKREH